MVQWCFMSHLLQGLCVGLLSPITAICDRPSVSVPEFCVYLPGSMVTCRPLYLEFIHVQGCLELSANLPGVLSNLIVRDPPDCPETTSPRIELHKVSGIS